MGAWTMAPRGTTCLLFDFDATEWPDRNPILPLTLVQQMFRQPHCQRLSSHLYLARLLIRSHEYVEKGRAMGS